jgi:hypothetical protein
MTTMLPAAFLDWWFAPWGYAASASGHASHDADLVGRRDAYRLWCAGAGVRPALPADFDAGWQAAALDDGATLASSAKLFGGLLAARQQQRQALAQLAPADRKWCMSIASVQPLAQYAAGPYAPGEALEVRGLTELSCRLEHRFPGMWSRLRLLLPRQLDDRVTTLLERERDADDWHDGPDPSSQRALRCWRLCLQRALEMKHDGPLDSDQRCE